MMVSCVVKRSVREELECTAFSTRRCGGVFSAEGWGRASLQCAEEPGHGEGVQTTRCGSSSDTAGVVGNTKVEEARFEDWQVPLTKGGEVKKSAWETGSVRSRTLRKQGAGLGAVPPRQLL